MASGDRQFAHLFLTSAQATALKAILLEAYDKETNPTRRRVISATLAKFRL